MDIGCLSGGRPEAVSSSSIALHSLDESHSLLQARPAAEAEDGGLLLQRQLGLLHQLCVALQHAVGLMFTCELFLACNILSCAYRVK